MKSIKRILLLLVAALMLLSTFSCSGKKDEAALTYEGNSISASDYNYILTYIKSQVVSYYRSAYSYSGVTLSEADVLSLSLGSGGKTVADGIREDTIELCRKILVIENMCAQSDLRITDESDISAVEAYISNVEFQYGGSDLFDIALARMGFTRDGIRRYENLSRLYNLLYEKRYGDSGDTKLPESDITKEFLKNYYNYEGAVFAYPESTEDSGYTDEEIKTYFFENFVKVAHVLYMTVDKTTGKELSEEKVAEAKSKAEAALEALSSGEKKLEDYKSENEDTGYEYIFTRKDMVSEFSDAAFEMEVGEYRCVKTQYGYHVMQKLELTEADYKGSSDGGGKKKDTVTAMQREKVDAEAKAFYVKLVSGEIKDFPAEDEKEKGYYYNKPSIISKTDKSSSSIVKMIESAKDGLAYQEVSSGVYVIRVLELKAENITDDVKSSIYSSLASQAFFDYLTEYSDKVTVNEDIVNRYDVNTLPMLETEFTAQ